MCICALVLFGNKSLAQDNITDGDLPSGDPIIRIFANFNHGLTSGGQSRAFEVRRVYLGYRYQINENFSSEVKVDIGSHSDIFEDSKLRRYAYFKTAALYWQQGAWNIRAGIIDTEHYRRQERSWKHRYIYKSMQDIHMFGPKADIGSTVIFKPFEQLEINASIMNGEGYTRLQSDSTFKYSAGITLRPISQLSFIFYYDLESKEVKQTTFSSYGGLQLERFLIAAEYNRKNNRDFIQDHNQTGLSMYLMHDLGDRFEVFGRFDRLTSNTLEADNDPWNLLKDGSYVIAGFEFQPIQQVKLALNFREWIPSDPGLKNAPFIYLNLEVSL